MSALVVSETTLLGFSVQSLARRDDSPRTQLEAEQALVYSAFAVLNDLLFALVCAWHARRLRERTAAMPWIVLMLYCAGTFVFRLGFALAGGAVSRPSLALLLFHNAGEWALILAEWLRPEVVLETLTVAIPTYLWLASMMVIVVPDLRIVFLLAAAQGGVCDFMLAGTYIRAPSAAPWGVVGITFHGAAVLFLFWGMYGGPRWTTVTLIGLSFPVYVAYARHARERSREAAASLTLSSARTTKGPHARRATRTMMDAATGICPTPPAVSSPTPTRVCPRALGPALPPEAAGSHLAHHCHPCRSPSQHSRHSGVRASAEHPHPLVPGPALHGLRVSDGRTSRSYDDEGGCDELDDPSPFSDERGLGQFTRAVLLSAALSALTNTLLYLHAAGPGP